MFILGRHEAVSGKGNIPPRSRLLSKAFTRITTEFGRSTSRMSTDEYVYPLALNVNLFLTCVLFCRKHQDTAVESKPSADTTNDVQMEPSTEPTNPPATATAPATRKRPRLDLASEPRERKRGKTMFGLLVGTLNKAKTEDKERSATDAVRLSLSHFRLS